MDMKHLNKPLTNNQLNPSIFFINFNETRKISFISREPQNICLIGEQSDKMERITTKGTLMAKGGQDWCVFDKRSVVHLRWTPCFFSWTSSFGIMLLLIKMLYTKNFSMMQFPSWGNVLITYLLFLSFLFLFPWQIGFCSRKNTHDILLAPNRNCQYILNLHWNAGKWDLVPISF